MGQPLRKKRDAARRPAVSKAAAKAFLSELLAEAEPILAQQGFVLAASQCPIEAGRPVMRLFVERLWPGPGSPEPAAVNLEDCARLSRALDEVLARLEEGEAGQALAEYSLELSSPGLDRPLTKVEDYERFQGRLVRLKLKSPVRAVRRGRLGRNADGGLTLLTAAEAIDFDFSQVASCRLEPEALDF